MTAGDREQPSRRHPTPGRDPPLERGRGRARDRAQANLAALAVALVLLTTATAVGVALADGALASADRDPIERRAAAGAADRLVAADAPVTERANVLNRSAVGALAVEDLDDLAPPVRGRAVRVRLDGDPVLERGDPAGGTTVRRVVLLAEREPATRTLNLSDASTATLPRRADAVTVRIDPGPDAEIETVRANDRVVLHDPSGIEGEATVALSRRETTRLRFEADGDRRGTVRLTYRPAETTKAVLEVTVGG